MKQTQPNRTNLRRQIASAIPLTLPLLAGTASATDFPIGVNFSENAAYLLGATESAGAPTYEQTNWNNRGRWGNAGTLNDNTGTATAVTLKWDATGLWNTNANEALGGNHKLMKGYLDSNGAAINAAFDGVFGNSDDKPDCLLTGLDTWMAAKGLTSYSVVIYSDGDTATGTRGSLFWLAATDSSNPVNGDPGLGPDITSRVEVIDNSNWGTTPTFTKVTGTSGAGNYTVFSNLTAPSFYLRAEEAGTDKIRATINAIQIIGTDQTVIVDTDGDGLPDSWESNYGLNPNDNGSIDPKNGPNGDPDGDTLTNLQEYNGGVDGTSPINTDSDGDGLSDLDEKTVYHTKGNKVDTDGDGLPDGWEVTNNFDPTDPGTGNVVNGANGDPDNDGSPNSQEYTRKTDPRDSDSDDDTVLDGAETGTGIWVSAASRGTNPLKADSDSDGFRDDQEIPGTYVAGVSPGTDPNKTDSDGDGTTDRWEFLLGTDPSQASSNQPTVAVANHGFELPTTATYIQGVPDSWTKANAPDLGDTFVENIASVGMTGGEGTQFIGIEQIDGYIYQDTGVAFAPNTTYLVDIAGGYRNGYATGIVEFGLFSSAAIGTELHTVPGKMNLNNTLPASGSPDADNAINKIRDASAISSVGFGGLAQAYALVTGATPPAGNIAVYVRHKTGGRVIVDNVRIIAVPNSLDSDSDGLPDAWELANRLDPKSATGDNGPNGDPDFDGYTNADELLSGSNPADINSVPSPPVVSSSGFNGGSFQVTITGLIASKSYQLKRSAALNNDFAAVGAPFTGAASHVFVDPAPPATRAFYRVEEVP
ncbi:hypothetical protein [Haloferula sp. BvORR071]|uniref:hypothetical protein n=1 Tax=Haloferula sp. BvORR071 TaxID=1396141 RepID=UPI0022410190|nr:hypothetical protein [Haloferula sp. BvORR071]